MDLLPNEKAAVEYVRKIGLDRAYRVINAIGNRIDRRYNAAADLAPFPINPEWIRKTPLERELMFRLQIGAKLLDNYFTPLAAKDRIKKRLAERKLAASQKKVVKQESALAR